jgi:hypothetical protein
VAVKEYFLPQSLTEATNLLAKMALIGSMAGGTIAMHLINEA